MPAPLARGRGRRTIHDINMVPFIDVMLVLLIIFMVTAPLITTGVVDLPSVGQSRQRPEHVIELRIAPNGAVSLHRDGAAGPNLPMSGLLAAVKIAQGAQSQTPVVISADKAVRYEAVVQVMDVLQRGGIQRVGLAVKNSGV